MKLVVDSNRLQSPELQEFLGSSARNFAVLTDFLGIEAYKGDTLKSIYKSMEILSAFPNQIVVLKGSRRVWALSGRPKGLQRRLIDEKQTRDFHLHLRALSLAQRGDQRSREQVLGLGRYAQEHMDRMLQDAFNIRPVIDTLTKIYNKEERTIIRDGLPYTSEMADKLAQTVVSISAMAFRDSQISVRRPTYEQLANTFPFRISLACYLMAIRRGALGGASSTKADKIRNDLVDMTFVAYGTYFDGVMSDDQNVSRMYDEACIILSGLFGAEVPRLAGLSAQ